MSNCPDCDKILYANATWCRCGWKKHGEKKKTAEGVEIDPDRYRCVCDDGSGQRCRNGGAWSPSTHGGGKWYCREHWRLQA